MMRVFVLLWVFVWCLGFSSQARATAYTVQPSGNDSGAGPWKTLQYAADHVVAGDIVTVEDGTYAGFVLDGKNGTAGSRIVFAAKHRGVAKITTASATGGFAQDWVVVTSSSFITIDGFDVSGASRAGISVLGNEDDGSDATDVEIAFCHSHDNGAGSSAGRHDGIFTGFARSVHIHDNHVHDNSEHGIYVSNSADNPIIERNDVHDNTVNGIQINADLSTGGDGIITNWRISQNKVYDNTGSAGINLDGASGGVLINNLLYGNSKGGITLFMGDGAVASSNNLVANNTVYNPTGTRAALQVADGANNNIVFNNILYAGSGAGLEIQTVSGLMHDYNLVASFDGGSASAHESSPSAATIFASIAGSDYQLATASAAREAGVAMFGGKNAPTIDLLGGARPVGVIDIGCYEAGASVTTDAATSPTDLATSSGDMTSVGATPDLSGAGVDGGTAVDGSTSTPTDQGGCGCGAASGGAIDALFGVLALVGIGLARRRALAKR